MTEKKASPEFELLQRIDGRLERFEDRFPQIERKAVLYGSAAGALAGGLGLADLAQQHLALGPGSDHRFAHLRGAFVAVQFLPLGR
ncbi:hypothetical protein APB75_04180, partial [Pseudomonas aeruginosa]